MTPAPALDLTTSLRGDLRIYTSHWGVPLDGSSDSWATPCSLLVYSADVLTWNTSLAIGCEGVEGGFLWTIAGLLLRTRI